MSQAPKKQTFLHGAALLALATAIVKVIGALYKLPLNTAIGELGFSYFSSAYDSFMFSSSRSSRSSISSYDFAVVRTVSNLHSS